jgi:hypothetical protein
LAKAPIHIHATQSPLEEFSDLLDNLPIDACMELTRRLLTAIPSLPSVSAFTKGDGAEVVPAGVPLRGPGMSCDKRLCAATEEAAGSDESDSMDVGLTVPFAILEIFISRSYQKV